MKAHKNDEIISMSQNKKLERDHSYDTCSMNQMIKGVYDNKEDPMLYLP